MNFPELSQTKSKRKAKELTMYELIVSAMYFHTVFTCYLMNTQGLPSQTPNGLGKKRNESKKWKMPRKKPHTSTLQFPF